MKDILMIEGLRSIEHLEKTVSRKNEIIVNKASPENVSLGVNFLLLYGPTVPMQSFKRHKPREGLHRYKISEKFTVSPSGPREHILILDLLRSEGGHHLPGDVTGRQLGEVEVHHGGGAGLQELVILVLNPHWVPPSHS